MIYNIGNQVQIPFLTKHLVSILFLKCFIYVLVDVAKLIKI